jgi:hypothetical protein
VFVGAGVGDGVEVGVLVGGVWVADSLVGSAEPSEVGVSCNTVGVGGMGVGDGVSVGMGVAEGGVVGTGVSEGAGTACVNWVAAVEVAAAMAVDSVALVADATATAVEVGEVPALAGQIQGRRRKKRTVNTATAPRMPPMTAQPGTRR